MCVENVKRLALGEHGAMMVDWSGLTINDRISWRFFILNILVKKITRKPGYLIAKLF